jgi:hypothetical protein
MKPEQSKRMNKILAIIFIGTAFAFGCDDIGNAPKGMSHDEAAKALDQLEPDAKIRAIAGSPMPQAEKEKRYKEIETETGVKASEVLGDGGPAAGPTDR